MPAKVEPTSLLPGLSPAAGKPLIARFDGGQLSSDGGLLALREVEQRLGLAERLAACIDDPRASERVRHGLADILRFRMLMIATGYEDGNDADWTSPLGLEGLLTNPGTPGGKDGGEANPTELHAGVQGAGGEAAAGGRPRAVGGGDGARPRHRAAQPVAHRAPGGRLGRGAGRPQGGAGGNAAPEARGEAARGGGGDSP